MFDDIRRLRPLCANGRLQCVKCDREWPCGAREGCPMIARETIAQRNARLNLTNWRPRAEDIP